jgi:hypothetical protein
MEQPVKTSWWSRNWKWFVPAGCLSMILIAGIFIALIFSAVSGMMKSSDAYKEGMNRARASAEVTEALGSPIKEGFFTSGSVNTTGPSGHAELSIPVSGPKGSGKILVVGEKSGGDWAYSKIEFVMDKSGEKIDLLGQQ